MKKILIAATLTASMGLSACGGKSEASREQIDNGREQAKEMIKATKTQGAGHKPQAQPQTQPQAQPRTETANPGNGAAVQPQGTDTLPE